MLQAGGLVMWDISDKSRRSNQLNAQFFSFKYLKHYYYL